MRETLEDSGRNQSTRAHRGNSAEWWAHSPELLPAPFREIFFPILFSSFLIPDFRIFRTNDEISSLWE